MIKLKNWPVGLANFNIAKTKTGIVKFNHQFWTTGLTDEKVPLTVVGAPKNAASIHGPGKVFGTGIYTETPTNVLQGSAGMGDKLYACRIQAIVWTHLGDGAICCWSASTPLSCGTEGLVYVSSGNIYVRGTSVGTAITGARYVAVIQYSDFNPYNTYLYLNGVLKSTNAGYLYAIETNKVITGDGWPSGSPSIIHQHLHIQGVLWSHEQVAEFSRSPQSFLSTYKYTSSINYINVITNYPENLLALESGEQVTFGDTDIINPTALGSEHATNKFLAGDGTWKAVAGDLPGSVGTILNKYNYGGF